MCLTCGEVIHTRRDQKFALRSRQERPVRPRGWRSGGKSRGAGSCCESDAERPERVPPQTARLRSIHATISAWGNDNGKGDHVRAAAARSGNTSALQYSERYVLRYSLVACPPQEPARTGRVTGTSREGGSRCPTYWTGFGRGSTPGPRVAPQLAERLAVWGPRPRGHHPPWAHTWGFRLIRPGWKWGTGVGVRHSSNAVLSNARPGGRNPG